MALQSFTVSIGALRDVNNNDKNYVSGEAIYVKTIGGSFAPIFRDLAGTSEISQDGLANKTNEKGQFTFFVEAGDYILEYQNQSTPVTVVGADYFNSKIEESVNQIIIDTSASRGFRVVGNFASGFTYELFNDVGIDSNGDSWIYTGSGSPSKVVTAGTVPSQPDYQQVTYNDHNSTINRDQEGSHPASAISLAVKNALLSSGNPVTAQDAIDWFGVNVEEFRKDIDLYDSDVINRAFEYVRLLPYKGVRLIFQTGRVYEVFHETIIKADYVHIDLNGATIKRADGSSTATTLSSALTVSGGTVLNVSSVPSNWRVGDRVSAFTSANFVDTSQDGRVITGISGNQVTISAEFSFPVAKTTLPIGTTIAKSFTTMSGKRELVSDVNRKVLINNGIFDGNASTQLNKSWTFGNEVYLLGIGCTITECLFKNVEMDCIVCHGVTCDDNTFEDLGGSCFHLSRNDAALAGAGFSRFINNTIKRTNTNGQAANGHAEGMVTFSWGAGDLIVNNNIAEDGGTGVIGAFGPTTGINVDKWLIVTNNICRNFPYISDNVSTDVFGVMIKDNIFHDCGDNTSNNANINYNRSAICDFSGNLLTGNTIADQWDTSNNKQFLGNGYGTGTKRLYTESLQWLKRSETGYSNALDLGVMTIDESAGNLFKALISTGLSGLVHYAPGGAVAGSAFSYWDPGTLSYSVGSNETGGKTVLKAEQSAIKLTAQSDGVQIEMTDDGSNYTYYGDSETDGSWRVALVGGDLIHQKRVGGSWVTKQTVSGA